MDSDEFVRLVSRRAHVPQEQSRELTRATMLTLAERITGGEARHLAGVLPTEIAPAPGPIGGCRPEIRRCRVRPASE
ncbi:DUF2267 domain-containing protein [Streptomyces sp. NPDC054804]